MISSNLSGKCDNLCNTGTTYWDKGDCIQLCFDNPLSSCNYSLLFNDQCDKECNNSYCTGYYSGSDFARAFSQGGKTADNEQCLGSSDIQTEEFNFNETEECAVSSEVNNPYLDKPSDLTLAVVADFFKLDADADWSCNLNFALQDGFCNDLVEF